MAKKSHKACYALYQGDRFVDLGSAEYLAKLLKVKAITILFYSSRAHRKRTGDRGPIVIRI